MLYNFLFEKEKYQKFGVNFSYKINVLKLDQLALRMIKKCELWKANWIKVREEIAPEVHRQFKLKVDSLCADMTKEEIQMFIDKIKELKKNE